MPTTRLPRMPTIRLPRVTGALAACALLGACGHSAPADVSTLTAGTGVIPRPAHISAARLLDWPEFGLNPQRSDVSPLSSGITAANVTHLRRVTVELPGTVDSSPIYLHEASVAGAVHSVVVVTTTYGRRSRSTLRAGASCGRSRPPATPGGRGARRSPSAPRWRTPTAASCTRSRQTG